MLNDDDPQGIVIVTDGRPVARLVPIVVLPERGMGHLSGILKGRVGIQGDIMSTGVTWQPDVES